MLLNNVDPLIVEEAGSILQEVCHGMSVKSGWWHDLGTGLDLRQVINEPDGALQKLLSGALVAQKICLSHSELSEGLEGFRKNQMDDKLPHRKMLEVELADAVIRIFDLAGALNMNVAGAITEKLEFNASRADHKVENRKLDGGKAF